MTTLAECLMSAFTCRLCGLVLEEQVIFVRASNASSSTGAIVDPYIEVELDPAITIDSASMTFDDLGNDLYRFDIDNLNPGGAERIVIYTTISCDVNLGETLCMEANLKPVEACVLDDIPSDPIDGDDGDNFSVECTPPWDKSSLAVEGWCDNDSVYFSVTNTGEFGNGNMDCYSPLWVTVDGVVTITDSIRIDGGVTVIYAYPATGQTMWLNVEQHPLHPRKFTSQCTC